MLSKSFIQICLRSLNSSFPWRCIWGRVKFAWHVNLWGKKKCLDCCGKALFFKNVRLNSFQTENSKRSHTGNSSPVLVIVSFHLFLPHRARRSGSNEKMAVNCRFPPLPVAFRPRVPRGDAAERDQECDPQWPLHRADRRAGSHPGLPVLHRRLHFLQGWLHPGGGPRPQRHYEWGWIPVAFPTQRQRWLFKRNSPFVLCFRRWRQSGQRVCSRWNVPGRDWSELHRKGPEGRWSGPRRWVALKTQKVTLFHHDDRSKEQLVSLTSRSEAFAEFLSRNTNLVVATLTSGAAAPQWSRQEMASALGNGEGLKCQKRWKGFWPRSCSLSAFIPSCDIPACHMSLIRHYTLTCCTFDPHVMSCKKKKKSQNARSPKVRCRWIICFPFTTMVMLLRGLRYETGPVNLIKTYSISTSLSLWDMNDWQK